ncbi:MAG: hypothetical protein SFU83_07050 [Meiothermus sp.]|nr:hypothetical protein [Meiothermus sp.]
MDTDSRPVRQLLEVNKVHGNQAKRGKERAKRTTRPTSGGSKQAA